MKKVCYTKWPTIRTNMIHSKIVYRSEEMWQRNSKKALQKDQIGIYILSQILLSPRTLQILEPWILSI